MSGLRLISNSPGQGFLFGFLQHRGLDINGDTSLYGCGIGDDLTKLFDLKSELGKPRASEGFIKPVSDVDDPHRGPLGVGGRIGDHITAGNNLSRNWHVIGYQPKPLEVDNSPRLSIQFS